MAGLWGWEKSGGGWFREEAELVIPLVVKRPAVDSSLNPISATFSLCNTGYVTSLMGLSFLSCKVEQRFASGEMSEASVCGCVGCSLHKGLWLWGPRGSFVRPHVPLTRPLWGCGWCGPESV